MSCDPAVYPLTFVPTLRHYIWGGRSLETVLGRHLPAGITAESWEISGHRTASTRVEQGPWAGTPLPDVLAALGERLVGSNAANMLAHAKFPLLIKILDAQRNLSVQVHPDDAYAAEHEGGDLGKVECWYVLHAEPHAELVYGLDKQVTPEAFAAAVEADALDELLQTLPIKAGDVVFLPAGTVHALKAVAMVIEIQQNSDSTYRVYDWGRLGADGMPRPLHISKALDVIDWSMVRPGLAQPRLVAQTGGLSHWELVCCPQFCLDRFTLAPGAAYRGRCDGATFEIWGCIDGQATIASACEPVSLPAVRFALLPAALGEFVIEADSACTLLRAWVPAGN